MFNNDVENGPKSEYGRENLTQASANGNTDITNTAKSKEKKEMFQIENQSVLNFETKNTVFAECKNHKDQNKSPRNKTSRDMTDLKFSIHDGSNIVKKSSSSDCMQMALTYQTNPIERHPLQPINNIINSLNIEEPVVKSSIVNNKGIAYPPCLHGNEKRFDEDIMESPSLKSKCSIKENSNTSNKSLTSGTSNNLPEENLECDSLGCGPDQGFQETLLGPLLLTNGAFEETKLQPVVGSHQTYGKLQSTFQNQSLSDDLLKSLNDGRCELTTDGPTSSTKMTEYLSQQVVPALQKQEEKSQRILNELSYQQKENQHLKEKINQLEQQLGLGHKNQLRMTSSQSQTQKAGCEYNKQFPVHYSIPVSEETGREETDLKPYDTSDEMRKLTAINKQLSDANHQWEVQWESLQRRQASEIERLNQVIRTFHEQEAKRQEDIDKILLSAKRRHNDAEDAKEDALGQLAQITGQFEELKVQYEELKTHLVQRTQEKSDLETELVNLKAEQMCLSQTKSKKESKSSDRKLIQQLKTDLQVLQQQLKVFEEDFDVERQDRAKAQSEKEKLKEELETARSENIKLTQKLKQSEQSQQSHYMNGHQHQPTAQPETDPYAQPFTPTMMLPRYNNQFTPNVVNTARQEQQEYGVWNCEFCTYVNHPQRVICEICGTQKGRAQVANTHSGFIPRMNSGPQGQHQQPYFPSDLCMDSGAWLN